MGFEGQELEGVTGLGIRVSEASNEKTTFGESRYNPSQDSRFCDTVSPAGENLRTGPRMDPLIYSNRAPLQ